MSFKKNTVITGFPFALVSASDGSAITSGTVTGYYTLDGGTQGSIAGTSAHEGNGQWSVDIAAGEINGDIVGFLFTHASAINVHFTIKTDTKIVSDLNDIAQSDILSDATPFPGASITEVRLAELAAANLPADIDTLLTRITAAVALASVCTEGRLAELDSGNIPTDLTNITAYVDELETRLSTTRAGYLDNLSAGAVALASVCTAARLGELDPANVPADIDTLLTRITAAVALASVCTEVRLAELDAGNLPTDVAANATPAEVNAEVVDVLKTDTITERAQGIPPTTPTFEEAVIYLYMALTKKVDVDSALKEFYNNAGAVIWKKALADDGSNYNEDKGQSGP